MTKQQLESVADHNNTLELRDELAAALQRHNELMAENKRLRKDLEDATAKALRVGPLERELEETKENLNEASGSLAETLPQLETTQRQLEVDRLRTDELEQENAKLTAQAQEARKGESARAQELDALRRELERQAETRRDELSDQSLIDELEDDLERTRLELEKAIKDRQRVERQLEFTKGDFEAEKIRVQELHEQLAAARKVEKQMAMHEADFDAKSPSQKTQAARSIPATRTIFGEDVEALRAAMDRAELRIDEFESQLKDARSQIRTQSEDFAASAREAELKAKAQAREQAQAREEMQAQLEAQIQAQKTSPIASDSETALDRAEAYIRKLKAEEITLKQDLQDAINARDELRIQLRSSEDALKDSQSETTALTKQVEQLEDVKERMGRVLMYQWGKEEVGEIERRRGDGKHERGMGFKYKYWNKDGSQKEV